MVHADSNNYVISDGHEMPSTLAVSSSSPYGTAAAWSNYTGAVSKYPLHLLQAKGIPFAIKHKEEAVSYCNTT